MKILDEDLLRKTSNLVTILKKESSSLYKKKVLTQCSKEVVELLELVYGDHVFNVTSHSIKDYPYVIGHSFTLVELLKTLENRDVTGNDALGMCTYFISKYPKYEELILDIIDKDLKCGIGIKSINSVHKGLIPDIKSHVPLASKYEEGCCDFEKETWYASRKLDGVRCLVFYKTDGTVTCLSRNGKEFHTLDVLKNDIKKNINLPVKDVIFDGELCIIDNNGNESFKEAVSMLRRKNYTIENPRLYVFDYYFCDSFYSKVSTVPYSMKLGNTIFNNCNSVQWLSQIQIVNKETFVKLCEELPEEWEGLMLRKEGPTEFKRSKKLYKVKRWKEAEFRVVSVENTVKEIEGIRTACVGSLQIKVNNSIVSVGTGLTDKHRIEYYENPELILGKLITVKYFQVLKTVDGGHSLRFPIFKGVRNYE